MWSLIKNLSSRGCVLEGLEEVRALVKEKKWRKTLVTSDLEKALLMEQISWRQKSMALRLTEGDKCTKFFHRVAHSNWRSNSIEEHSG